MLNSEGFLISLQLIVLLSSFTSVFLLVYYLFPDEKRVALEKRLGVAGDVKHSDVPILRLTRPLFSIFLPYIANKKFDSLRSQLHKKLLSANLRDDLTPDEFIAFKWVMMFLVGMMVIYLSGAIGNPLPFVLWPFLFVSTYYFADLWLYQRIQFRRRQITQSLPYTMDLLTLSVEAGLDFIAAIARVSQRTKSNALIQELNQMLREIKLGTSRADALRNLSDRLQIEEVSSFTTLLIQANQLGAPIGNVLRAQSDQLRTRRFQTAETLGAKASQMVLFPLVICIFPAIFIVVLGPTLISFLQRGPF